jgi:hypothetical protein
MKMNRNGNSPAVIHRDRNAVLGIMGILALGIFLLWFPRVILQIPVPKNILASNIIDAMWTVLALNVMPYLWAVKRLGMKLSDLGISSNRLVVNTLAGCGLYSIALIAILRCSSDPVLQNHIVGQVPTGSALVLMICMGTIAAATDITTRGFVLLTLAKHSHVVFAIFMQNLVWFTGHLHEIKLLSNCLGMTQAILLTLTLGIIGDIIVLRTRSLVGLAVAHFLLNVVLTFYIRQL